MVAHIRHSLKQTENNVMVEVLFEDDANYPEPEDATYDKLNDFNEERKGTGMSGWSTNLRWGSTLSIETFAIFNSRVLPNIWSEQSACTSLNKNDVTRLNLL